MDTTGTFFDSGSCWDHDDGSQGEYMTALDAVRRYADRQLDGFLDAVVLGREIDPADLDKVPLRVFLKLLLLSAIFSVASDRDLCRLASVDNALRHFLGFDNEASVVDAAVFARLRRRLRKHSVTWDFYRSVVVPARAIYAERRGRTTLPDRPGSMPEISARARSAGSALSPAGW